MKKIICTVLTAIILLFNLTLTGVSAAEVTQTNNIYFKVPTKEGIAWKNFSMVYCHIWQVGGDNFYAWQAKEERCSDLGNGYWSYDISNLDFNPSYTYAVIFSNENGMQTYDLTITSDCKGDIVYCDGSTCINPVDAEKVCTVARWINNKDSVHPVVQTDSNGNLVDPDSLGGNDENYSWGESAGISVEMPKVEITSDKTEVTEETNKSTESTGVEKNESSVPIWLIIAAVAIIVIVIVAFILLSKRKRK